MDAEFWKTLLILAIAAFIIMTLFSAFGLSPAEIIWAIRGTRRVRVDQEPRDQWDRFVASHRSVARDTKPRRLKYIALSGDVDVPTRRFGRVVGCEPWTTSYLVFVRTRILSWSKPYLIPRHITSDVNRRTLIVDARGFSCGGPLRWPIPRLVGKELMDYIVKVQDDFRTLFELQIYADALEDSAWAYASAMMPALDTRAHAAELEVPQLAERQVVSEERAAGRETR